MRLRRLLAGAALAAAGLGVLPTVAAAAPAPFGHACQPKDGARLCPTTELTDRVPSWDGVPLDVDVWLPPAGEGPFPTIAMLHGYGGDKTGFQNGADGYSAQYYARRGYAVVVPTARGFARSCGSADSRAVPGCEKGYIHLGDSRYEVRDVQFLLGTLVDQGVARADGLGATGISYGGGTSLQLAYLKDRVRLPDGSYARWTSRNGTPLSLATAWPRWPWSDLADALGPNGRLYARPGSSTFYGYRSPPGVMLKSYTDGLYGVGTSAGFVAPKGSDPGADLATWYARINRGEPYDARAIGYLRELHEFHGAGGIAISATQKPAPMVIQSGWTDWLFPAWQGVRPYEQAKAAGAVVALQLGDLGHAPGRNFARDGAALNAQGLRFFERYLKGAGAAPKAGVITAYGSNCASKTAGIGPWSAPTVARLARGQLVFRGDRGTIGSRGGDSRLAGRVNALSANLCRGLRPGASTGTVRATSPRLRKGATLAGPARIALRFTRRGANAQVAVRIWDRDPKTGTQRLVDRSVTRLPARSTTATLLTNGNGWAFARGHRIVVELLGRDAPTYRPSNGSFTLKVSKVRVTLPTRESRPS